MATFVFTAAPGEKPVEINALWYHAPAPDGREYFGPTEQPKAFRRAFWISPYRGLADVVEGSPTNGQYARRDLSIRPNQIFCGEPRQLCAERRSAAGRVVEVVRPRVAYAHGSAHPQ